MLALNLSMALVVEGFGEEVTLPGSSHSLSYLSSQRPA